MSDQCTENGNDEKDSEDFLLSFAQSLNSFAETLPKNQRLLLATILINMMDPIERMNWRKITSVLEPDEIEILEKLQSEGAKQ